MPFMFFLVSNDNLWRLMRCGDGLSKVFDVRKLDQYQQGLGVFRPCKLQCCYADSTQRGEMGEMDPPGKHSG